IINQTLFDANDLIAEAHLFDIHGKLISSQNYNLNVSSNSAAIAGNVSLSDKPDGFLFLRLLLKNEAGEIIDENIYPMTRQPDQLQELNNLAPVTLQLIDAKTKAGKLTYTLRNSGSETAFFTRLRVIDEETDELMLPVFFNDNYLTLFPDEQKNIEIDITH